jgi:hypothetical protein
MAEVGRLLLRCVNLSVDAVFFSADKAELL